MVEIEELYEKSIKIDSYIRRLLDLKKDLSHRFTTIKHSVNELKETKNKINLNLLSELTSHIYISDPNEDCWKDISYRMELSINKCYNLWINNIKELRSVLNAEEKNKAIEKIDECRDWIKTSLEFNIKPIELIRNYVKEKLNKSNYWTKEEDKKLIEAVRIYGIKGKWNLKSNFVVTKTKEACRARYLSLYGSYNKNRWSVDEDRRLLEAVKEHGKDWIKISSFVITRSPNQCFRRYKYISNPQ